MFSAAAADTEVVLHAFLEWDTDAFARLDGIFAFALWQKAERRLVLVRDRLGVKPLFCCLDAQPVGVRLDHRHRASATRRPSRCSMRTVCCTAPLLGPARPPESGVFRGISPLLPGSFAVLTPEGFRQDPPTGRLEAHEH